MNFRISEKPMDDVTLVAYRADGTGELFAGSDDIIIGPNKTDYEVSELWAALRKAFLLAETHSELRSGRRFAGDFEKRWFNVQKKNFRNLPVNSDIRLQYIKANGFKFIESPRITMGVEDTLRTYLGSVPEVLGVYINKDMEGISVWTLIDKEDDAVCDKIYDLEMKVMETIPTVNFDFHVFPTSGYDTFTVMPTDSELIYKRS